jgi:hypothetical protein
MTTGVAPAEWIKRIADDERRRDAVRVREEEAVARRADLVRLSGRRLLDELHMAIARDIEAFREEFPGDPARDILLESDAAGGFVVRKPGFPSVTFTAVARLEAAAALDCHYRFFSANGMPPREDRFELVFADDGAEALRIQAQHAGHAFATTDALSEYLLGPVFTGRPR